jgi:hypothetical protein
MGLMAIYQLIGVFLNHQNEFADHIGLGAVNVLMFALRVGRLGGIRCFFVIGVVFGQVGVHPDFDLSLVCDKNHLLHDVKVANFFVEELEAIECRLVHVKKVLKGNVVDFLESEFNLIGVQVASMNGGTHFVFGLIDEVSDGVNDVVVIIGLRRRPDLPVGEFGRVGIEIFLSDEVEFILFNQLVSDDVGQESPPVRIDVGKYGILLVLSGLDPVFTV